MANLKQSNDGLDLDNALAHRIAIAKRFAARMNAGDAFFLGRSAVGFTTPYTVDGEVDREFGGVNALMLMQVMQDRGWTDSRFFTTAQIADSGWMLQSEDSGVRLQYLLSSGDDGLPLEQPQVKEFRVFNGSEIQGLDRPQPRHMYTAADVENAASAASFTSSEGVGKALEQWLRVDNPDGYSELSLRIAASLLEAKTGVAFMPACSADVAHQWACDIDADPLSFFAAAQQGHLISASVMKEIQIARSERQAVEAIESAAGIVTTDEVVKVQTDKGVAMVRKASPRVEELFKQRQAVLSVPFAEKDRASTLGAVWYGPQRLWFVPQGVALAPFSEWNVREHSLGTVASVQDILHAFSRAMEDLDLEVPPEILADGAWHNVRVSSIKKYNKSGAYILSLDGSKDGGPIGTINNKWTGESMTWLYDGPGLTPEQRALMRAQAMEREVRADREHLEAQNKAAIYAKEIWSLGTSAEVQGYVKKKGIDPQGLRQISGSVLLNYDGYIGENGKTAIRPNEIYLLIPMMNEAGDLRAVQAISPDGKVKSFMRGAQKKGLMHVIGADSFPAMKTSAEKAVIYSEGYATGDSIHNGTGLPVIVCFDAGNLETVFELTKSMLPSTMTRVLGVDNDQFFVERALSFLKDQVGVNPHSPNCDVAYVANGKSLRPVPLGDVIADGKTHQAPKGTYCATFVSGDGVAQKSLVVEVVPNGLRKTRATFENRGVEVGCAIIKKANELAAQGQRVAKTLIVVPEFKDLKGRPTDFNDQAERDGMKAVTREFIKAGINLSAMEHDKPTKAAVREPATVER